MIEVRGTFFRAVDPRYASSALDGSRGAGRYNRADQPTLYLSSSREGVDAAMIAHRDSRTPDLEVLQIDVVASGIVDLRDPDALHRYGVDLAAAAAPWQEAASAGQVPSSWLVRDQLEAAGAHGLIDPSRQRPGLWHLVLFQWNDDGPVTVRVHDSHVHPSGS